MAQPPAAWPPPAPPPRSSVIPNLLLPLFALLVFFALLYARRMLVAGVDAQEPAEERRIPAQKTQESPPSAASRGALDDLSQIQHPFGGEGEALSDGGLGEAAPPPSASPDPGRALSPEAPQGGASAPVAEATEATPAEQPAPQQGSGGAAPDPLVPAPWPYFKVSAIANGKEKLVILNGSEMLATGETSRAGVKVLSVSASSATFLWRGEERTLHRGDVSADPPAPSPPSTSTNAPATIGGSGA